MFFISPVSHHVPNLMYTYVFTYACMMHFPACRLLGHSWPGEVQQHALFLLPPSPRLYTGQSTSLPSASYPGLLSQFFNVARRKPEKAGGECGDELRLVHHYNLRPASLLFFQCCMQKSWNAGGEGGDEVSPPLQSTSYAWFRGSRSLLNLIAIF